MQNRGNGKDPPILGPDGRLIDNSPPGLIILKTPGGKAPSHQIMEMFMQATHSNIIVMPYEHEIMMGEIAQKQLVSMHSAIHAILGIEEGKK